ncbi:unnamed protein product [Rhizoctonia solani]|uniref:Uncharacterized protein n=1 Tax=Rhizoctonia solani TaxID=456999 RepID=A0A8H3DSK6_9AGAM|nr:unnamed protein product [Rhizoctonia solani]
MRKIPGEILEVNDEQDMCNNLATNLRELLDQWWNENGTDVLLECCRQATARSIWDIEETSCRTHIYNPPIISLSCRLSTADPTIVYGDPPRLVRLDPSEYDLAGPKLLAGMRVTTGKCDVHLIAFRLSPYDISWQAGTIVRHPLSIGPAIILSCLDSFKQNMLIEINRRKIQGEYQDVEVQTVWDLENIPRYGHGKNSMFWWRKEKQPQEQEIMTTSTILEMRDYIGDLISAHGIRVEEYKWATKVTAAEVNRDIGRVMEEIWKGLVDQHL